jgi:hypothetical protein
MSDSPGRFPRHPLTHNGLHSPHRGSRSWPAARGHRLSARRIGADLRRHSESFTKLPSLPGMLPPAPTFPLVPALIIEADSARLPRASWKLPFAWQGARTSPPCRESRRRRFAPREPLDETSMARPDARSNSSGSLRRCRRLFHPGRLARRAAVRSCHAARQHCFLAMRIGVDLRRASMTFSRDLCLSPQRSWPWPLL